MQMIISAAIIVVLLTSIFIVLKWGRTTVEGEMPVSMFAFIAILFTSGLDVGLIMFPLTEFPIYETEAAYSFSNPLAVGFGFWGFLIWSFYFLTTFYFCAIEPKLKLFEIPIIKIVNNIVIIGTCAFTGYLFLTYLPGYFEGLPPAAIYAIVAAVVLCAILSSTHVRYVKILSVSSTLLFYALIAGMWLASGMGFTGLGSNMALIGDYFATLPKFVSPVSDYHEFYLFWWFAWSIMIGQFVARFVGNMKVWKLLVALLVFPSIPIALWFSVLYFYHSQGIEISGVLNLAMIGVGTIFVINSLDSLTRLYTDNLNLSAQKLGTPKYIALHFTLLFSLILLYQFTPLKIEWIGLIVIGLYAAIYVLLFKNKKDFELVTHA
ncbi:MAG: BCCT family transporter [Hellea sp.]